MKEKSFLWKKIILGLFLLLLVGFLFLDAWNSRNRQKAEQSLNQLRDVVHEQKFRFIRWEEIA